MKTDKVIDNSYQNDSVWWGVQNIELIDWTEIKVIIGAVRSVHLGQYLQFTKEKMDN